MRRLSRRCIAVGRRKIPTSASTTARLRCATERERTLKKKDYINIRYLSITETMRHAAKTYDSTLAMLQLDTILRYSVKFGKPKPPKRGVKNQEIFTQMQEMRCELVGIGEVKMMVGIKRSGEKIQYCITAIQA